MFVEKLTRNINMTFFPDFLTLDRDSKVMGGYK